MAITVSCACGKVLRVDAQFAGKQGRCPGCGQTFQIPHEDGAVAHPVHAGPPALPAHAGAAPPPLPHQQPATVEPDQQQHELTNHGGGPIDPDADFFVDPPPEIGELVSAHSTMKQGEEPMSPATRTAIALFCGIGGGAIGLLIALLPRIRHPLWLISWPLGLAAIGALIAVLLTQFKRKCSYVGREGVARYTCQGGRRTLTQRHVFRFRDAHELKSSQTRHYVNGGYQGTNYSYVWTDINGVKRCTIDGKHNSEAGTPALTDPYYLATSAEFAWTMHLVGQIEAQMNFGGAVTFSLSGRDYVRVSPGQLDLCVKGAVTTVRAEQVAEARVDQGTFVIKEFGAREGWFSSEGVFKFQYSELANAQLFLILLDKVAGIRLV